MYECDTVSTPSDAVLDVAVDNLTNDKSYSIRIHSKLAYLVAQLHTLLLSESTKVQ